MSETLLQFSLCLDPQDLSHIESLKDRMVKKYGTVGYGVLDYHIGSACSAGLDSISARCLRTFQEYEGECDIDNIVSDIRQECDIPVSTTDQEITDVDNSSFHEFMCKGSGPDFDTEGPTVLYNSEPYLFDDDFFRYNHSKYWEFSQQ